MATKGYIPEKSGSKVPPEFAEKFNEIQQRNYVGQGKWFLNGFWESLSNPEQDAEQIWGYAQKFAELDTKRKKEGVDLDEFESHKFLETLGETMTVIQMRQALREIDLDNNNRMSLIEYLTFKYKKKVGDVVNAPQGGVDPVKLQEAQELIDKANQALEEMQIRLQEQKEALARQKKAEEEARRTLQVSKEAEEDAKKKLGIAQEAENEQKKKLEEQKKAEEEVRNAEEELRKILDEIKKQEQDYKDKCDDLERKTKEGTIVQKNRAVQELAALKQEDPLPLRKAKISQEAAVRKAEKVTKAAQEITRQVEELTRQMEQKRQVAQEAAEEAERKRQQAEEAAQEAEKKRQEAEEAARQVELAVEDARQKVQEAEDNFEKVRQECKTAYGDIFWMERDIKEAKKYLPKSKQ